MLFYLEGRHLYVHCTQCTHGAYRRCTKKRSRREEQNGETNNIKKLLANLCLANSTLHTTYVKTIELIFVFYSFGDGLLGPTTFRRGHNNNNNVCNVFISQHKGESR